MTEKSIESSLTATQVAQKAASVSDEVASLQKLLMTKEKEIGNLQKHIDKQADSAASHVSERVCRDKKDKIIEVYDWRKEVYIKMVPYDGITAYRMYRKNEFNYLVL